MPQKRFPKERMGDPVKLSINGAESYDINLMLILSQSGKDIEEALHNKLIIQTLLIVQI